MKALNLIVLAALFAGCSSSPKSNRVMPRMSSFSRTASENYLEKTVANWPARPKLAVQTMRAKYGEPLEVTSETVTWHDEGPFKRITVSKTEVAHDFPKPHMDFIEHTVAYAVPVSKVDDLLAFDGSLTINRTAGELSARCDQEAHNILTLNMAHDVAQGIRTSREARNDFSQYVVDHMLGNNPPYAEKLQFEVKRGNLAAFGDSPAIPGAPVRAVAGDKNARGDAEIMALVMATDDNEVLASTEAQKKSIDDVIIGYAKLLHAEHGKNQSSIMELGKRINVVPANTKAVEDLRAKGADELASIIALDGKRFEKAFIRTMIKNHREALSLIDNSLLPRAKDEQLREHLSMTRHHVASHLEQAEGIASQL